METQKEQFLIEHNRMSPENLRATEAMLCQFEIEKAVVFKNEAGWSIDKIRRPFILWLTSLTQEQRETMNNQKKRAPKTNAFQSFPRKTGSSNCLLD